MESYREWAWEIFSAVEKHCKTEIAYGSLPNVQRSDGRIGETCNSAEDLYALNDDYVVFYQMIAWRAFSSEKL